MSNKLTSRIYLDYASLTPIDPEVVKEMALYSGVEYANPSSLYKEGVAAKKAMEEARKKAAAFIGAHSDEVIFTSGGTESNNLAIIGAVEAMRESGVEYKDMHVITSVIEHSSVRECVNYLSSREVKVDVISVDRFGVVDLEDLGNKIRPNTVIVSIMTVNNEVGTLEPIRDIAKIIRHARSRFVDSSIFNFQSDTAYPLFHTDAAQAVLFQELNVEKLGVDLLTIDSSKAYGPRGIGMLYKKRNVLLTNIIHGGGQESGLRSGTETLPQVMGFVKALELAALERSSEAVRIDALRKTFVTGLISLAKGIRINSALDIGISTPHILNISIPRIDSEMFLFQLDTRGIACSTKSSCLRDEDESYVLKAIGADSKTSLRFSFGRWTKDKDIKDTLAAISELLK